MADLYVPNSILCLLLLLGIQAELQAAYTEGECVKKKLKLQEAEMAALRTKQSDKEYELCSKYSNHCLI